MRRLTFPVVTALVALVACESTSSDTTPPAANAPDASTPSSSIDVPDAAIVVDSGAPPADAAADSGADSDPDRSATIGAAGGKLEADEGRARITVPEGALPGDQTIAVKRLTTSALGTFGSRTYDFSPNGLSFAKDAQICLRVLGGGKTDGACLGYLDETKSPPSWKCEDSCLETSDDGLLCGNTDHFTNFAILLGGGGTSKGCSDERIYVTGGKLASKDGLALLTIADGVLDKPMRITMNQLPAGSKEFVSGVYDLAPSAKFKKDVELCITPLKGFDTSTSCLGYFDEEGKKWVCQDTCLEAKGDQLCGTTNHFTNFALLLTGGSGTKCK